MPSERLSDDELATWIEQAAIDWPTMTGSILTRLTDEIRERRAADLSDEESESLRWVRGTLLLDVCAHQSTYGKVYMDKVSRACAVITRLLGGGLSDAEMKSAMEGG